MHILDSGLKSVYSVFMENSVPQLVTCTAPGEWQQPGGLACFCRADLLVTDAGNNSPKAICCDYTLGTILVQNLKTSELMKFVITKP